MKGVIRVIPDPERALLGAFFETTGLDSSRFQSVSQFRVLHIDIDLNLQSWTVYLQSGSDAHDTATLNVLTHVEQLLPQHLANVNRVTMSLKTQKHSATSKRWTEEAIPPPTEPPFDPWVEQDNDTYMAAIFERAKDWAGLEGGEDSPRQNGNTKSDGILLGRAITGQAVPLTELQDEERQVIIEGQVISLDVRTLRSGRRLITFDVTDRTDSIAVKVWEEENDANLSKKLSQGDWIKIRGGAQVDQYTGELVVLPRDCMRIPAPPTRRDTSPNPRVELHCHTKMSALDGAIEVDQLIQQAKDWGHKAIAITDHGVVQAFPEAYAAASKAGIKLIYGVEGYLVETADKDSKMYHIILLATNQKGLVNLYKLISYSHMNYFYRRPRMPRALIEEHREGLLIGSACEAGELYQAILNGEPEERVQQIARFYDYLEIQPLDNNMFLVDEGRLDSPEALKRINRKIVQLGEQMQKPVVATGDVHFLQPDDEIFRQIIMAGHGFDVERSTPLYFRTTDEMLEEFSYLGEEKAYEVVVATPQALAERIESLRPVPDGFHPPHIPGAEDEIRSLAQATAKKVYGPNPPTIVVERLERELSSIIDNGYASLYLIAHRLVDRSLKDGYLVGSRGSVGSSLAATMCGITEVNPLPPHYICPQCFYIEMFDDGSVAAGPDLPERPCPNCGQPLKREGYDIPFETFLGFHGDKVPDIDLNFSGDYQPRAHKYAEELLGRERVYRAGTIARLADRTAYGYVKNFLDARGIKARNAEINRLIRGCSGIRRTTGQHPGGLMVVPEGREIFEFTPIQHPADRSGGEVITTHFDCDTIHDTLVKLDILGHDDPTILRMLEDMTGVDVKELPVDDPKTLQLFSGLESLGISSKDASGEVGTLGIPEFGTRFVRQMLVETRPTTVGELIRISGLSHGTNVWTGNAQELIRKRICTLKDVIATRDDIMIYLIRAGLPSQDAFTIMEKVRRGRGVTDEEAQQMRQHGVPQWYIESCQKISYMFPKAHAAAYVLMALRIAYFKVHHPLAFYAAYFSVRADDVDADLAVSGIHRCRQELQRLEAKGHDASAKEKAQISIIEVMIEAMARGIAFLPVHLYRSDASRFTIEDDGLRCPFQSLPGVGQSAAQAIRDAREKPFTSISDLQARSKVTKAVIQVLKDHGTLESLPESDQIQLF